MNHLFINVFDFGGELYVAEAIVAESEEKIGLMIDPPVHPDFDEAVERHLEGWLLEVVDCHNGLRERAV